MATNSALTKAKNVKNDEFYTQLVDIERELLHYREYFKEKTVFCNCDDPYESNFFKYFAMNFNFLGLKKLICTSYDTSPIVYTQLSIAREFPERQFPNNSRKAYKIEITEVLDYNGDGAVDLSDVEYLLKNEKNSLTLLKGDGDFRSEECIKLLKQADMVVTNPPFSLFREYVAQLIEYDKKFIIIGNKNAITYKEIFPLLKKNKVWIGYEQPSKFLDENGKLTNQVQGLCRWFTNIDISKRHEELILYKTYNNEEYPKYNNYNAININKTQDIPFNYDGVMGVPITFLDKYNPEQFEILGITLGNTVNYEMTNIYRNAVQHNKNGSTQGGSKVNTRAAILVKEKPNDTVYYTAEGVDGYLLSIYPRILIRRKK